MKKLLAACFAAAAVTLVGCAAPGYEGGGGMLVAPARAKKRSMSMISALEQPPSSDWNEPAPRVAASEPRPPAPAPEPVSSISGIGARLKADDGAPAIADIIPGGPAAKDGRLRVGDVLTAVAQGDGPWAPMEGMSGPQVIALVRGESGTIVRLKVLRGGGQTLALSLVRAPVAAAAAAAPSAQEPLPARHPSVNDKEIRTIMDDLAP